MKQFLSFSKINSQIHISSENRNNCGVVTISNKSRIQLTNFIRILFAFTYYLGISPFRFVRNNDGGPGFYRMKVWKPQQLICAILHVLCIFRLIAEIRDSIPENWTRFLKNPIPYFDISLHICAFFFKVVTLKRFWFNGAQYLEIVNFILCNSHIPVRVNWSAKPSFLYALFGISTLKILTCLITGYSFVAELKDWTPSWWLRRILVQARFVFYFSAKVNATEAPALDTITVWDIVLVVLMLLTLFIKFSMSEFCDLCILSCTLTLWTAANSFAKEIDDLLKNAADAENRAATWIAVGTVKTVQQQQHPQTQILQWSQIYRNFQAILKLSEVINDALGSQVTWYLAEGLMYYSINLNTLLVTKNAYNRIHKILFFVLTFNILYISADICNKMEKVKCWLARDDNVVAVPVGEVQFVLHEMLAKDIGIKGSNAFTITFTLVAEFLSLIITFFVICVQEHSEHE